MIATARRDGRLIPVMLVARELDQGGVERDVAKIARYLDPSRFQPHVASYSAHGMRYDELRAAGIPLLHLPVQSIFSRQALAAAIRLAKYLREHAIQVLHCYDVTALLGVPVARCLGLPAVLGSQLSNRQLLDWKSRWLLRMTDPLTDVVVVNCRAMQRHMVDDEGLPEARVELCHNGVETTQFHPSDQPRPAALSAAPLVVGTVCVLRPEKALHLLQEAFAQTLRPAGAKLVIVGSGPELPRLEKNAAALGIAAESLFIPATQEVPRWMRTMDIFVLPSTSEAFSNSLLEAMACGCAVIGSRVGGTPELIGDEERGLLFASGNAAELAQKLSLLVADRNLRLELAARASQFARENLTIEIAARRTAEIYEKLLRR